MFDWQTIAVTCVVLVAALYVARRAWMRLQSFRASVDGNVDDSCATGCGSCGNNAGLKATLPEPAKIFVQISRSDPIIRHQKN